MATKKLLILCVSLYSNIVFADVTIFNKSSSYDMVVKYNICIEPRPNDYSSCAPSETIKVKHADRNGDGYSVIQVPYATSEYQFVNILSATQKDDKGNIIADAQYGMMSDMESNCSGSTTNGTLSISRAFVMEGHSQLPLIMCHTILYNVTNKN